MQTINTILQFFEEESVMTFLFLMTKWLNMDSLENLFSTFRQKGGYNKNPTSRTIKTSIRSSCIFPCVLQQELIVNHHKKLIILYQLT